MSIGQILRTAMLDSKLTRYAIAQASGINQSVLSRFAHDQRGLQWKTPNGWQRCWGFSWRASKRTSRQTAERKERRRE